LVPSWFLAPNFLDTRSNLRIMSDLPTLALKVADAAAAPNDMGLTSTQSFILSLNLLVDPSDRCVSSDRINAELRSINTKIDSVSAQIEKQNGIIAAASDKSFDEEYSALSKAVVDIENQLSTLTSSSENERISRELQSQLKVHEFRRDEIKFLLDDKKALTVRLHNLLDREKGLIDENKALVAEKNLMLLLLREKHLATQNRSATSHSMDSLVIDPNNQCRSSDFSSKNLCAPAGFGYMPKCFKFDPTPNQILNLLVPTQAEIDATLRLDNTDLFKCSIPLSGYTCRTEANDQGVSALFRADCHRLFPGSQLQVPYPDQAISFAGLGMPVGFATGGSTSDFFIRIQNEHRGVGESKSSQIGIMRTVLQGAVNASHVALSMHARGFRAGTFLVPVICTTDGSMQFGATILLPDSTYPVFYHVSPAFDLSCSSHNRQAVAYMRKAIAYCEMALHTSSPQFSKSIPLCLSERDYFLKRYNSAALKNGLGMFGYSATGLQIPYEDAFDIGLEHMVECLNRLNAFNDPQLRASIAFPNACLTEIPELSNVYPGSASDSQRGSVDSLSESDSVGNYVEGTRDDMKSTCLKRELPWTSSALAYDTTTKSTPQPVSLVFPNLAKDGFQTGCPNRVDDPTCFDQFKAKLKRVVSLMHLAGVIHCDLYLSNVMWRLNPASGEMEIKLIAFDISHQLCEGDFAPHVRSCLENHYADLNLPDHVDLKFGTEHDLCFLSVLDVPVDDGSKHLWIDLSSNDVGRINSAFKKLLVNAMSARCKQKQNTSRSSSGSADWSACAISIHIDKSHKYSCFTIQISIISLRGEHVVTSGDAAMRR
jgi:hypothetical protein